MDSGIPKNDSWKGFGSVVELSVIRNKWSVQFTPTELRRFTGRLIGELAWNLM
jgi:hypothetical protein